MAILGTGSLQENLLTNSGFDVWSNSTLENVPGASDLVYSDSGTNWTGGGDQTAPNGYLFKSLSGSPSNGYAANIISSGGQPGAYVQIVNTSNQLSIEQVRTTVVGKLYRITFYHKNGPGTGSVVVSTAAYGGGTVLYDSGYVSDGDWTQHTGVFEATTTSIYFSLKPAHSTTTLFDTVEIFEVTPGCIAANGLGPDTWSKSTNLDCFREHTGSNVKDGTFYGVNLGTVDGQSLEYPEATSDPVTVAKFAGRTVTFGCWMKSDNSSSGIILWNGNTQVPDTHTGGNTFEWLECTTTIDTNVTEFKINIRGYSTSANTYACQPMLVFGSSIGEGNYSRPTGEIIWFENETTEEVLTSYSATQTVSSNASINLETQSEGKIPKGVRAIQCVLQGESATVEGYLALSLTDDWIGQNHLYAQVANQLISLSFWQPCNSDGDVWIRRNQTFNNVRIKIGGVQLI